MERYKLIPDKEYDEEADELIFELTIPKEMIHDVSKQEQKKNIEYINWFLSTKFEDNIRVEMYKRTDIGMKPWYELQLTSYSSTFKMNCVKYYVTLLYELEGINLYVYRRDLIKGKHIGVIKVEQ